jgi:atlastin
MAGRPLQVVRIALQDKCVILDDDALLELESNLKKSGAAKVAILAVMGAYRTGKSFLLDVFLRYLKRDRSVELTERKRGVEDLPLPEWLSSKGNLTEGTDGSEEAGFTWRPGMQKCTEGIWIWSQPFIEERTNADGETEKVAVLLMDTQGAWDSCLSKEDSATIFGLTSVLSSRQVYNISKQIQEDKVENLHWFVECARSAMRSHEGDKDP